MEKQELNSGKQTQITPEIKQICEGFSSTKLNLIYDILNWMQSNIKVEHNRTDKMEIFRKRTAEQIIKDGFATGCSDLAIIFSTLIRGCGFPARYVEMIASTQETEGFKGHVIVEVQINNKWLLVDPTEHIISMRGFKPWKEYTILARGLDSWDIGIRNFNDLISLSRKRQSTMET